MDKPNSLVDLIYLAFKRGRVDKEIDAFFGKWPEFRKHERVVRECIDYVRYWFRSN